MAVGVLIETAAFMWFPDNRNKKRRKRKTNADKDNSEDEFGFSNGGQKRPLDESQEEENAPPRKRQRGGDSIRWIPTGAPKAEEINKILRDYEELHCESSPSSYCHACSCVGENLPYFNGTVIQELLIYMYNGFRTTNMAKHCIHVYEQFEGTIRQPRNEKILQRRRTTEVEEGSSNLIPEWKPSMIKEHMESHHTDPELIIELMARHSVAISRDIYNHCLFKKGTVRRPKERVNTAVPEEEGRGIRNVQMDEGERHSDPLIPEEEYEEYEVTDIDPDKWKIYKEAVQLSIQVLRSNPTKMVPYYKKDRFIVEQKAGHPFFDVDSKKIVTSQTGGETWRVCKI